MAGGEKVKKRQIIGDNVEAGKNVYFKNIRQNIIDKLYVLKVHPKQTLALSLILLIAIPFTPFIKQAGVNINSQNSQNSHNPSNSNNNTRQNVGNTSNTYITNNHVRNIPSKVVENSGHDKNSPESKKQLEKAEKESTKNPNSALNWANLGDAKRRCGDLNGAVEAYKKAFEINPNLLESKVGLALVEKEKGNISVAVKELKQALKVNKSLKYYQLFISTALSQEAPDYQGLEQYTRQGINSYPYDAFLRLHLVIIMKNQGKDKQEVYNELKKVEENFSTSRGAQVSVATLLIDVFGIYDEAARVIDNSKQLADDCGMLCEASYYYLNAKLAVVTNRVETKEEREAVISSLRNSVRINPKYPVSRELLAILLLKERKASSNISYVSEAEYHLKEAIDLYKQQGVVSKVDELSKVLNTCRNAHH